MCIYIKIPWTPLTFSIINFQIYKIYFLISHFLYYINNKMCVNNFMIFVQCILLKVCYLKKKLFHKKEMRGFTVKWIYDVKWFPTFKMSWKHMVFLFWLLFFHLHNNFLYYNNEMEMKVNLLELIWILLLLFWKW